MKRTILYFFILLSSLLTNFNLFAQSPDEWVYVLNKKKFKGRVKFINETSSPNSLGDNFNRSFYYNNERQVIEMYDSTYETKSVFAYNEKKQIVSVSKYDKNNQFTGKTTYEYENLEGTKREYSQNNIITGTSISKFDQSGNILEYKVFQQNGKLFYRMNYKYDSRSNLIEIQHDYMDGNKGKAVYKYDSKNNQIEEINYSAEGQINNSSKFKYNSANEMIEHICYFNDGRVAWTKKYIYSNIDTNGNWKLRTCKYIDGKDDSQYTTKRQILYH